MAGLDEITVSTRGARRRGTAVAVLHLGPRQHELERSRRRVPVHHRRRPLPDVDRIGQLDDRADRHRRRRGASGGLEDADLHAPRRNGHGLPRRRQGRRQEPDVTTLPKDIGGGRTTANYIGRSVYSADRYLKGSVRDFRIYNRALSAAEVARRSWATRRRSRGVKLDSLEGRPGHRSTEAGTVTLPGQAGHRPDGASSDVRERLDVERLAPLDGCDRPELAAHRHGHGQGGRSRDLDGHGRSR